MLYATVICINIFPAIKFGRNSTDDQQNNVICYFRYSLSCFGNVLCGKRSSVPSGLTSCNIEWTATNGLVSEDANDERKAKVEWNDTPGASGTVTATFVDCTNESNNGTTSSKTELILSVKNQAWGSYGTSINVDYCTKGQVYVTVPHMYVQGTGGIAQPPQVEVAYGWTLPTGWWEVDTHATGFVGTSTNFILIEPVDCSKPASVTVFGTLKGAGPFCNEAANSATATISLNGANPVAIVGPQAGYTGGSACNRTPVTFFAATNVPLGCIDDYDWVFPGSWEFISETANSITLRPSGTPADANPIKATISFSCGSEITSGNYVPPFNAPAISLGSSTAICSAGTLVTLANAGSGAQVQWVPSSNMTILSGQGTPQLTLKGKTALTSATGSIAATLTSCPGISVPTKSVWVGKPYAFLVSGPTLVTAGSYNNYSAVVWNGQPPFAAQGLVTNGITWSFGYPPTSAGWDCFRCLGQTVLIKAGALSTYVTGHVANTCGTTTRNYEVFVEQENCPPGGCDEPFFVYPNPSSEELLISNSSPDVNGMTEILLVDSYGTTVHSRRYKSHQEIRIPVKEFKDGLYYLSVVENGKTMQKQLIIKH